MKDARSKLDGAIERTHELNEQARAVLEKALDVARDERNPFADDYPFKYAMQMLEAYTLPHNVAARYFLAPVKDQRKKKKQ